MDSMVGHDSSSLAPAINHRHTGGSAPLEPVVATT